jgi:hypothetical protein
LVLQNLANSCLKYRQQFNSDDFVKRDSLTRVSTLDFFLQSIPLGSMIKGLNYFRLWLQIRRDIRIIARNLFLLEIHARNYDKKILSNDNIIA